MKLIQLCTAAGISCPSDQEALEIRSLCTDSRRVEDGALYICIKGLRSDGHRYAREAIEKGAVCILAEKGGAPLDLGDAVVLYTENTRRACAFLFDAWYENPCKRLKIIGVTGTNGKTSVTHMIKHILEASLHRCGLIGTVGSESAGRTLENHTGDPQAHMTTPDPEELYRLLSEMASDGVEYVLMEVSSHALTLEKLAPIDFTVGIFTNLTPEHLDFHGDMEHYSKAKERLFAKSELSIINLDSPYGEQMKRAAKGRTVTLGTKGDADYTLEDVALLGESGVEYRLCSPKSNLAVRCPVPGSFAIINSMQAAACALELGIGAGTVKDALASFMGVKGRMEKVRLDFDAEFHLFIDYAHTPDALEKLLLTARGFCQRGQRIVLVFGCGGDRDRGKRPAMGRIATTLADRVIITSDNSRSEDPGEIIKEILDGVQGVSPTVIPDRREAIREAVLNARRGDVILLAGKGHEEYEINQNGVQPFCERRIAQEAFEERSRMKKTQKDWERET